MLEATTTVDLNDMGKRAKDTAQVLARATTDDKNRVLLAIADALEAHTDAILAENALDLKDAEANGVDPLYIRDRLDLRKRMPGIVKDVQNVVTLPDPVGRVWDERTLDNGLRVHKRRTPLGVLGVIYEARPNVTVDVATLAFKTGNAVILRGGSEVLRSNKALVNVLRDTLEANGCPADLVQYIDSTDRAYVGQMLKLHNYIDMIIPRGGSGLHDFCRENSTIPVITGGIGICHMFVDASANIDKSLPVIHNAKTQRPAVCNALDTLLVHESVAADVLPKVVEHLGKDGVTFRADERAHAIVGENANVAPAGAEDFDTEWYALILGLKVVDTLDEALDHIRAHSTFHSESILTETPEHAARFLNEVDSAAVFHNASTRFNDGSALGLGAEVAISTQKLHARGPMGLEELTTFKWVVAGDYTARD